ncbi:hypothetical protein MAR_014940, partial [Mya arenaria]
MLAVPYYIDPMVMVPCSVFLWYTSLVTLCQYFPPSVARLLFELAQLLDKGCKTLVFEGKGDFREQRKIYIAQTAEHYIFSLGLLKRTSFYKCKPSDTRYGISDDGHSWWVDGPNNGAEPPPDPLTKLLDQLKKRLSDSTQTLLLYSWNPNSFMNRFESISPM